MIIEAEKSRNLPSSNWTCGGAFVISSSEFEVPRRPMSQFTQVERRWIFLSSTFLFFSAIRKLDSAHLRWGTPFALFNHRLKYYSHPESSWHTHLNILFKPGTWVPQEPVKLTYKITHPGRKHSIFISHSCVPFVLGARSHQTVIYWCWVTVVIKMEKQILQFNSEAPNCWRLLS